MAQFKGANFEVEGLAELQAQLEKVGKVPKKELTKAAKAASNISLKEVKASAPVGKNTKTRGTLKKSISRKMETPNKRNKTVYRVQYNPKFTDVFLKPTTGAYGGETPNAYYPASVEYGYKAKRGKVQGKYFMEKALERVEKDAAKKLIESLSDSINNLTK
jgi:HK97 gp10 family phage protein